MEFLWWRSGPTGMMMQFQRNSPPGLTPIPGTVLSVDYFDQRMKAAKDSEMFKERGRSE